MAALGPAARAAVASAVGRLAARDFFGAAPFEKDAMELQRDTLLKGLQSKAAQRLAAVHPAPATGLRLECNWIVGKAPFGRKSV